MGSWVNVICICASSYAKKNKNDEKKCIGPIGGNIS
jgi:hypothetical protein